MNLGILSRTALERGCHFVKTSLQHVSKTILVQGAFSQLQLAAQQVCSELISLNSHTMQDKSFFLLCLSYTIIHSWGYPNKKEGSEKGCSGCSCVTFTSCLIREANKLAGEGY